MDGLPFSTLLLVDPALKSSALSYKYLDFMVKWSPLLKKSMSTNKEALPGKSCGILLIVSKMEAESTNYIVI